MPIIAMSIDVTTHSARDLAEKWQGAFWLIILGHSITQL
jgi:hypothetical protein